MSRGADTARTAGFTLLETLIALAVMSLVSLVAFQSLSQLGALSTRAGDAAERTVDRALDRAQFVSLLSGVTPAWPEDAANAFRGNARAARGLSVGVPLSETPGLAAFALSIDGDGALVLAGDDGPARTLATPAPAARIAYLGTDRLWRESWPPDAPIPFGPADAPEGTVRPDHILALPPAVPEAIRIEFTDGTAWIAPRATDAGLPETSDAI